MKFLIISDFGLNMAKLKLVFIGLILLFFILFLVPFVNLIVLLCHIVLMCQPSNAWVMYSKDSISSIQSRKKPKNDSNIPVDQNKYPRLKKHRKNY